MKNERSNFRKAVYEGIQDSKQLKKNFFFADIRLDSTGGISLIQNFTSSAWLHIQVNDQQHVLSDLTHSIHPPSTTFVRQYTIPRADRHVEERDHLVHCQESDPGFRVYRRSVTARNILDLKLLLPEIGSLLRMNAAPVTWFDFLQLRGN